MLDQTNSNKRSQSHHRELPPIPDKLYFTIGEVTKLCSLKGPHVLRYWEQEFSQLKPHKRRKRRYYQRKDVLLIREIISLLYDQGFTIEGARAKLSESSQDHAPLSYHIMKETIANLEGVLEDLDR